jgi:hypothetical protein
LGVYLGKQLKYIEEYERQVFMRQETVEKEAVLKASKVKSKDIGLKNKEVWNSPNISSSPIQYSR